MTFRKRVVHKLVWFPKRQDGAQEATACQFRVLLFAVRPSENRWSKVTCKRCKKAKRQTMKIGDQKSFLQKFTE